MLHKRAQGTGTWEGGGFTRSLSGASISLSFHHDVPRQSDNSDSKSHFATNDRRLFDASGGPLDPSTLARDCKPVHLCDQRHSVFTALTQPPHPTCPRTVKGRWGHAATVKTPAEPDHHAKLTESIPQLLHLRGNALYPYWLLVLFASIMMPSVSIGFGNHQQCNSQVAVYLRMQFPLQDWQYCAADCHFLHCSMLLAGDAPLRYDNPFIAAHALMPLRSNCCCICAGTAKLQAATMFCTCVHLLWLFLLFLLQCLRTLKTRPFMTRVL